MKLAIEPSYNDCGSAIIIFIGSDVQIIYSFFNIFAILRIDYC